MIKVHDTQLEAKMERVVTWTTGDGREARVVVNLRTSKELDADGDKITVPCCEIDITASVAGEIVGYGYPRSANHPVAVAMIGKLGLIQANLDRVKAAIAEIEAGPEWQEKMRKQAVAEQVERDYQAHCARMRKIMME